MPLEGAASFSFNKIFVVDAESAAVKVCLQDKRCTLDAVPHIAGQGALLLNPLPPSPARRECTHALADDVASPTLWACVAYSSQGEPVSHQVLLSDGVSPCGGGGAVDGVMRWLEEFASRLLAMRYRIIAENGAGVPATLSLSLFDTAHPAAAEAVRPCLALPTPFSGASQVHAQSASCALNTCMNPRRVVTRELDQCP